MTTLAKSVGFGCCDFEGPTDPIYTYNSNLVTLWKYDAKTNNWNYLLENVELKGPGEMVVLQGIIHYFLQSGISEDTLGFYFDSSTNVFLPLNDKGLSEYYVEDKVYPVVTYLNVD